MARQQNNIWKRIQQAEGKSLAGLKHVQFINGRAVNSEDDLCAFMVQWWDQIWPDRKQDLIHIPNEGSGSKKRGADLKKIGVRSGVPDYIVCKNGQPVGWIEVKFGNNTLEASQKEFRDRCKRNGVYWAEVRSFDQFKQTLQKWGLYDPEIDKPKFFQLPKQQNQIDIRKIFKR